VAAEYLAKMDGKPAMFVDIDHWPFTGSVCRLRCLTKKSDRPDSGRKTSGSGVHRPKNHRGRSTNRAMSGMGNAMSNLLESRAISAERDEGCESHRNRMELRFKALESTTNRTFSGDYRIIWLKTKKL
jgi:hypothetical protein